MPHPSPANANQEVGQFILGVEMNYILGESNIIIRHTPVDKPFELVEPINRDLTLELI